MEQDKGDVRVWQFELVAGEYAVPWAVKNCTLEVSAMGIVNADASNLKEWVNLALMLFPESSFDEELALHKKILASGKEEGLLYQKNNRYVAFMNLSIRNDYVNGTDTSPVVFVEALYVLPDYQRRGIGKKLIEYAENYARQKGITQLASDCYTDNLLSESFHKNCGFVEKERVICFVKNIES